ncbi:MAG: UDP-3-O-(3-hydroxymyristoyl)glucosamine N-acyltransferase [Gammaproteobacteria bacterium]
MQLTLAEIAQRFSLDFEGDAGLPLSGVCGLSDDIPGRVSFIGDAQHVPAATASRIAAFVTTPAHAVPNKANLFHADPDYMIARIAGCFAPSQLSAGASRHASAVVSDDAMISADVELGAHVVIGAGVSIGARTRIFPNVVIMDRCTIGEDCVIYPNCTLREDSVLGARVILQPGVSIGGDGYGYVTHGGRHFKIPQLGRVVLEDDVEIGANSTVDRARFSDTRVGRGTKVDNLVMIAHNVVVGADCLLVAQVGVSGSTRLGDRVTLAGQVGTVGHVTVTDDVTVLGKGGITKDIREPGIYAGMPIKPAKLWRRAMARLYAGLR